MFLDSSDDDNESLFGDGNVIKPDPRYADDFYALLNVPRDATIDVINRSYKQRCLVFHPDRHTNEQDQRIASKVFIKLKKAYEVLTNPRLRSIYDAVGSRGLEMEGWQISTTSTNPEHIRKEYEFLKRLHNNEILLQQTHPTSNFVVKTSLVGFFQNEGERYLPEMYEIFLNQSIDCIVSSKDRIGLSGTAKNVNGKGEGSFVTSWKRPITSSSHFENSLRLSPDSLTASTKLAFSVKPNWVFALQPSLSYQILRTNFEPSINFVLSMNVGPKWIGTIQLNLGYSNNSVVTSLVNLVNDQPKFVVDLTLTQTAPQLRIAYTRRLTDNDSNFEASCSISPFEIVPSLNYERKLSRFSRIGVKLAFSVPSCVIVARLRVRTSLNNYQFHFLLCDNQDDLKRSTVFGVALPFLAFNLVRVVFSRQISKLLKYFEDSPDDSQINQLKREEAERIVNMMRETAERIVQEEERKDGLVILQAQYGQMLDNVPGSEQYPLAGDRLIDVTIPLQSLVNDSKLRIYSGKEHLPGFYDPCPDEPKILKISYRFRGRLYSLTIAADRPLNIPMRAHLVNELDH